MSRPAIRVERLSKRYRIGARGPGYRMLRESIVDGVIGPLRRVTNRDRGPTAAESVWALQDVDFQLQAGEALGIIGHNGAGKSTLLRILSRITEPTSGRAVMRGRVASLLEVGTGFHPELTGRENIYLNGAVLGMTRREMQRKFDEIVGFAEVETFIDTPVKRYSSGMYLRLAFAVAAHLDPEILLIDEVLAVGDAAFQRKCLGTLDSVARSGRTVLFVSHNLAAITRMCRRTLWVDRGRIAMDGDSSRCVAEYLSRDADGRGAYLCPEGYSNPGITEFQILAVRVRTEDGVAVSSLDACCPFTLEIDYRIQSPIPYCRVGFLLRTMDGVTAFEAYDTDDPRFVGPREPGEFRTVCRIPGELLNANRYSISVNAGIPTVKNLAFLEGILTIHVRDTSIADPRFYVRRTGVVRPRLDWGVTKA